MPVVIRGRGSSLIPKNHCLIKGSGIIRQISNVPKIDAFAGMFTEKTAKPDLIKFAAKLLNMVRTFQDQGHLMAKTDPLDLPKEPPFVTRSKMHELTNLEVDFSLESFGFSQADRDRKINVKIPYHMGYLGDWNLTPEMRLSNLSGSFTATFPSPTLTDYPWTVGSLYDRLKETYCGTLAIEYSHITNRERINWLKAHLETPVSYCYSPPMKRKILQRTIRAVLFETFAGQKFATLKRFGLDGCESFIVGMKALTKLSTFMGVETIVLGMSHRGRLNTLHNIMKKPAEQVFAEFAVSQSSCGEAVLLQGKTTFGGKDWGNLGDVKYHLGVEYEYVDPDHQKKILMSMLPNPSHLESVNPVVLGTCRARQQMRGDDEKCQVLPVLVHGDASISGQGSVYETVQMADTDAYSVGGTIHIVINNQIGFTTPPCDSGSGIYCTDLAKAVNAPIFHVNADDPEAVTYAMEIAVKYRQKFKSDIFIDLVGYRRFGHNELDMPKFTQPKMYTKIGQQKNVLEIYAEKLIGDKVVSETEYKDSCTEVLKAYDDSYKKSKAFEFKKTNQLRPFSPQWHDMATPDQVCAPRITGVERETLESLGTSISTLPADLDAHPTIKRIYSQRRKACLGEDLVDFGLSEALAFASLARDGYGVRLVGQDSERGTFSHRHAAVHDQLTGTKYFPVKEFCKSRSLPKVEIYNSSLSEYASMGFEYGFSLENPNSLNIWEAQFGDFANGAQIIIDQYFAAGEVKWNYPSGLVLLLPHGYDGQGPEHSSGRIERFLQLSDDREDVIHPDFWKAAQRCVIQKHNIQIVNASTAANFFHVLRRQMHRGFRKPLVVFSPKKLLRFKEAMSPIEAFTEGTRFQRYISDPTYVHYDPNYDAGIQNSGTKTRENIKRLVICSGQVYYDLVKLRAASKNPDEIIISRVEQLSPFPLDALADEIKSLPKLESVVWTQEEPMNQGSWFYVSSRINVVLKHCQRPLNVIYAGRNVSASPAVGDHLIHVEELNRLCSNALDLTRTSNSYFEKYN